MDVLRTLRRTFQRRGYSVGIDDEARGADSVEYSFDHLAGLATECRMRDEKCGCTARAKKSLNIREP